MTYLSNLDTSEVFKTIVTQNRRITPEKDHEVRNITLTLETPGFSYREGQHVGIIVPGAYESGHEKHFRVYSIANSPGPDDAEVKIELCVRRCSYLDETSGVELPGISSSYLCDLKVGDSVSITGPYGEMFKIPKDPESNLLMIGSGTGIAPFRAFIQHINEQHRQWKGQLLLFYGPQTGAETLYVNDHQTDLENYYDEKTYTAFNELSQLSRKSKEGHGNGDMITEHTREIWNLLQEPKTHLYLAGLPKTRSNFDAIMQEVAGSSENWRAVRDEMVEDMRWAELIYR